MTGFWKLDLGLCIGLELDFISVVSDPSLVSTASGHCYVKSPVAAMSPS